ncbi:MAG: AAA family ATPase [Candidatus Lokiarchaeota archaeon]|nr:AAA family ATPase [Candidatus Lokiarchaeota archaeon]
MVTNYFENLLKRETIFKAENTLDINYLPDRLPHREKELSLLSQLFISLITIPNSLSRKILITGGTGIGKTVTVKIFGNMLVNAAQSRNVHIKYIHINCRKERTSYKVLINIIRQLQNNFPKRGYSPQDLLEIILKTLQNKEMHILLVLDELNYLINKDRDLVYSLTRIYDDSFNSPQRISIIGIVRDLSCLNNLDSSTISTLQNNIIKFNAYSIEQIFEILKYRTELSLKENVMCDDVLKMLSEITYDKEDIRYGLNILWKACKIAESKYLTFIPTECLRLANQEFVPYSIHDLLKYMKYEKLLLLLSIATSLKNTKKTSISLSETLEQYHILCENTKENSKSYSQLWNYLNEFKKEGLITIELKSKNIQGRRSYIKILDIPLNRLENLILKILETKGIII